MTYLNAVKRILTAPMGSDRRSADRLSLLFRYLGLPQKGITLIKIFGESGKSACASMLSHALRSRGYRVGALTTPFSHVMTECVAVNCVPVSMDGFTESVSRVFDAVGRIRADLAELSDHTFEEDSDTLSPTAKALRAYHAHTDEFSPFSDELLLMAALWRFVAEGCQIVIIEVPHGDRAGAYRLPLPALVSVITTTKNLRLAQEICRALDKRTEETITAIQEKAIYTVIADHCAKINCRLTMPLKSSFYPSDFAANRLRFFYKSNEYNLNSGAMYQALNLLTVLETLTALKRRGLSVDPAAVDFQEPFGIAGVELQFTYLSLHPTVITDFADTPARLEALCDALRYHKNAIGKRLTLITETANMSDETLSDHFAKIDLPSPEIVRTDAAGTRRTLKPLVKSLTSDDTLIILGSRPFVYEATRALREWMA